MRGSSRETVGGRDQRRGFRGKKDVSNDTDASESGEVESGWGSRGRVGGRKGPERCWTENVGPDRRKLHARLKHFKSS